MLLLLVSLLFLLLLLGYYYDLTLWMPITTIIVFLFVSTPIALRYGFLFLPNWSCEVQVGKKYSHMYYLISQSSKFNANFPLKCSFLKYK